MIVFTRHAKEKFRTLRRHGFHISKSQVEYTLRNPELIDRSRSPLLIAQRAIDKNHVLRVVYQQEGETKKTITFYPGRRKQYEKKR